MQSVDQFCRPLPGLDMAVCLTVVFLIQAARTTTTVIVLAEATFIVVYSPGITLPRQQQDG